MDNWKQRLNVELKNRGRRDHTARKFFEIEKEIIPT